MRNDVHKSSWLPPLLARVLAGLLSVAPVGDAAEAANMLRLAQENWAQARELVRTDPAWRKWLAVERTQLDAWMAVQRDSEESKAGWIHDFADASSGAFLAWSSSTDCAAYRAEPRRWRGCLAVQRLHNMRMVQAAARLDALEGERRYGEWAARQLDMYARIVLSKRDDQSGSVLFAQTLEDAMAITLLADARRLLLRGDWRDPERATHWCEALLLPVGRNLLQAQKAVHNIAVWHAVGAGVAALECEDRDLQKSVLEGSWSVPRLLEQGMSEDGFWIELSLGYQVFVVQALHELLLAAALRGHANALEPVRTRAVQLLTSPQKVAFGGGDGPTINDSNRPGRVPDPDVLKTVRRMLPTALGVERALANPDWELLLDQPSRRNGLIVLAPPPAGGREIPGLKSLFLDQASWKVLLRAGQKARFHAHQDTLSIELKHGDTWLLRNSPTPAYGSTLHRSYYKLAAAHSTPLVNDRGVSNWFADPVHTSASAHEISAEIRSFHHGISVRRSQRVEGAAFEDRIDFHPVLKQEQGNRYGALYHTDCKPPPAEPMQADALPATPGFEHMAPAGALVKPGRHASFRLDCGGNVFLAEIQASEPLRIALARAPALNPARLRNALLLQMESSSEAWLTLRLVALGPNGGGK